MVGERVNRTEERMMLLEEENLHLKRELKSLRKAIIRAVNSEYPGKAGQE